MCGRVHICTRALLVGPATHHARDKQFTLSDGRVLIILSHGSKNMTVLAMLLTTWPRRETSLGAWVCVCTCVRDFEAQIAGCAGVHVRVTC